MFGLTVQDLVGQVVDDVPVVAGKSGDEVGDVVTALDRERGQLQGGDPALRPPLQRDDILAPSDSSSITSLRYAAASSGVKRRSAARISMSSPRPRQASRAATPGRRGW